MEGGITSNQVEVGESFQLKITVSDEKQISNLPWPDVKGLEPFSVSKNTGTSSSSQTTIINGRVSQSKTYVTEFAYTLTAKEPGQYNIGPITYVYKDYSRNLGSVTVTVNKAVSGLELQPRLNKKSVYVGEQIKYSLRIIPKSSVQQIRPPNFQKEIGKTFFMVQLQEEVKPKTVEIDGNPVRVFDIEFALFPLLYDNVKFPSYSLEYDEVIAQRSRRNSVFDDFFGIGGKVVQKTAFTQPLSLSVKPLPPGQPEGFSGAVGSYSLNASVDKTQLKSGDALTLTVIIEGDGQPKAITNPILPELEQFEVFAPEVSSSTRIENGIYISKKTFKYVLVPSRKGNYTLSPLQFHFFDANSESYKTLSSPSFEINVAKGKEIQSGQSRLLNQKNIEELGSDIRHIKKLSTALENSAPNLYKMPWYWILYILGPFCYILLLIYKLREEKLESDSGLRRKVQAKGIAKKRLAEARKAMAGEDSRNFYKTLSASLERFASDKLNKELRGLTLEDALQELKSKGLSEENLNAYKEIMEECDMGQFASAQKDLNKWQNLLGKTENLINNIDKHV